jgi:hypothetical protein
VTLVAKNANNAVVKMAVFRVAAPCRLVSPGRWVTRPDDGGSKGLWNAVKLIPVYTALQPRRQPSSYSLPSEPQALWRYGGACGGVSVSRSGGSLESGGRFCVRPFGRNLSSVAVKMFPRLIYYKKKFYKVCVFNAISKDNAAINCILFNTVKVYSRQIWWAILH